MTWPTVTIGRLTLREVFDLDANINSSTNKRTLNLRGQESSPSLPFISVAEVKRRQEDILGLNECILPVIFGSKSDHNGWYYITDVNTTVTNYGDEVIKVDWSCNAQFIGPENSVDIESRLAYVTRQNDFGLAGERWHAPAGGAFSYYTGSNVASATIDRPSIDGGPVTVYRGVPAGVSPRWTSTLAAYGRGRARVLLGGVERVATSATGLTVGASAWELSNGLFSVSAAPSQAATLQIATWSGSAWAPKLVNCSVGSSTTDIGLFDSATIVRNDYEAVTIRLTRTKSPGRSQLDLTLRRGAHFVEGYMQTDTSAIMGVSVKNAEAGTAPASAGYITATANDANGNRYILGSARTSNFLTTQGGVFRTAATTFDFFAGQVLGGGAASAGNAATALRDQFIVFSAEESVGVRR